MEKEKKNDPSSEKKKYLAIIVIVVVIITVVVLINFRGGSGRNDDVNLSDIERETTNNTVVIYFWDSNCGYCEQQKPVIEELENDYDEDRVIFHWVKASDNNELSSEYDVRGIPTTIILGKDAKVFDKFVGLTDKKDISKAIEKGMASFAEI